MNWFIGALKKYAVFKGRARRKEYWMFVLFSFIISFALVLVDKMLLGNESNNNSLLLGIYNLAILVPSIAVGVRRMHDTDHRGWWLLLPIVNLIFAIQDGQPGENRFGPDPKAATP
jgi:uncharacterized membrane protein YhaH (DUF805 family)